MGNAISGLVNKHAMSPSGKERSLALIKQTLVPIKTLSTTYAFFDPLLEVVAEGIRNEKQMQFAFPSILVVLGSFAALASEYKIFGNSYAE